MPKHGCVNRRADAECDRGEDVPFERPAQAACAQAGIRCAHLGGNHRFAISLGRLSEGGGTRECLILSIAADGSGGSVVRLAGSGNGRLIRFRRFGELPNLENGRPGRCPGAGQREVSMAGWVWAVIVIAALAVLAAAVWQVAVRRRTERLRERFGPE